MGRSSTSLFQGRVAGLDSIFYGRMRRSLDADDEPYYVLHVKSESFSWFWLTMEFRDTGTTVRGVIDPHPDVRFPAACCPCYTHVESSRQHTT